MREKLWLHLQTPASLACWLVNKPQPPVEAPLKPSASSVVLPAADHTFSTLNVFSPAAEDAVMLSLI
jgi:hypothetical protein